MAILYAVVARGTTVLAEFSAVTGNTGAVARRILEKMPTEAETRLCYSQDRYIFHILKSDGLTFLCMANDTFGRRIPFTYLEDIHMRFMKNYGRVATYAPAYAMNDEFSRVLHQQMEFFSSNPSADTLARVRGEVSEIRTIMVDNIEKILERGDRIELLVDKTATMQDSAFHFKKQSKRLRRALWMKNAKLLASAAFEENHRTRLFSMVAGKKTEPFLQDEMVATLPKCRPEAANSRNLGKTSLGAVIFGCKNSTIKECLFKQLFGLPAQHFSYVRNITPGLPLFLFNYSDRKLYGIFEAASSGQMNIDPYAWTSGGTDRTQYPAQVQVRTKLQCQPLSEKQFKPIISDNYFSPYHFWFELDHAQTNKLISKLSTMAFAPGRFPLHFVNKSMLKSFSFPLDNKRDKNGSHELPVLEKVESLYDSGINFSTSQPSVPSDSQDMLLKSFSADPVSDREELDLIYNQLKELYINRESENASMRERAIENSAGNGERLPKEFPQAEQAVPEENGKNPESSLELPDFPSVVAQLLEEVNELKAFKEEQIQKTEHMKMRLLEAEEEIYELNNRCMLLESISRPSMVYLDAVGFESLDNVHLDFDESIFLVGGYDGVSWLSALDLYCPSQDKLKTLKPMGTVRSYSSVVKLNGELYVFGGGNGSLWYDTVESYNPVNNQWSLCPSMNEKKGSLAGAMLDSKIFAIGGGNGSECFSDVEMYDINVGSWIPTQSMLEKRFALAAAVLNGAIYAVGGYDGFDYLKSAERFDPRDHSWRRIDSMSTKRGCHSVVVMNEKLYALGGFDEYSMSSSVEIYDPRLGRWMVGEPMNESRGYLAAAVLKESIYVIGGVKSGEDILDTVEHYKEGQGWHVTNSKGAGRRCFCSAIVLGQD